MSTDGYVKEIEEYRSNLEQRLRAPDGWLTLAGLHWLHNGTNSVGSAVNSTVILPPYTAPQEVGHFYLENGQVYFQACEEVEVHLDGTSVNGKHPLQSDINHNPSILTLGDLTFFVIQRGERIGVRVKQVSHPNRLNFKGRVWWPIDNLYRVKAAIKRYDPPKFVEIPDVIGGINETVMDCALEFILNGQTYSLDAETLPNGKFYVIFHDQSCGKGSYPAGRFLKTEDPQSGSVIIDFNKAYNPPCAFTPFATCPLPPRQNYLDTTIQAGERYKDQTSQA